MNWLRDGLKIPDHRDCLFVYGYFVCFLFLFYCSLIGQWCLWLCLISEIYWGFLYVLLNGQFLCIIGTWKKWQSYMGLLSIIFVHSLTDWKWLRSLWICLLCSFPYRAVLYLVWMLMQFHWWMDIRNCYYEYGLLCLHYGLCLCHWKASPFVFFDSVFLESTPH